MSKHKKTRKEKIISDLRRQLYSLDKTATPQAHSFSKPVLINKQVINSSTITITSSKTSYAYLKHDILKSLTLTLAIVIFQIVLSLILKKHIFLLPGVSY